MNTWLSHAPLARSAPTKYGPTASGRNTSAASEESSANTIIRSTAFHLRRSHARRSRLISRRECDAARRSLPSSFRRCRLLSVNPSCRTPVVSSTTYSRSCRHHVTVADDVSAPHRALRLPAPGGPSGRRGLKGASGPGCRPFCGHKRCTGFQPQARLPRC